MKEKYIELMERALSAYTDEHIRAFFDDVKRDGLTEHGFPRLTANIGILIAHDRCEQLKPLFLEMMEFCCETMPTRKAANDFSIREIICCISEIEQSGVVEASVIERWKDHLRQFNPMTCYNRAVRSSKSKAKNWALFAAVSEFFRMKMGLCESEEFIERQVATQLPSLDENGMYMDAHSETHHPFLYDMGPRGLFSLLLEAGYRGRYYEEIDDAIKRAGILTLKMQSPNGEIAFGGRSNQYIFNEPWMIAVFEHEASRYAKEGNTSLVREFKAAIHRALRVTEKWLSLDPVLHIKNRFPTETKFGCEEYGNFNKYMITTASNLYAAYLLCDDSIGACDVPDHQPTVFATSYHFHKLFVKAGGYGLEFDLNADPHYDASGLGRVHREDAPSAICMSVPCPENPKYCVNIDEPFAFSLAPGIICDEKWEFATSSDTKYEVVASSNDDSSAYATLCSHFACGTDVTAKYTVNSDGVKIQVNGDSDVAYTLPAFYFDGEVHPEIVATENSLNVSYNGWVCRYTTDGRICDGQRMAANRNGNYKVYYAVGKKDLKVSIEILRQ